MTIRPEKFPKAERCERYRRKGHWGDATLLDYWEMSLRAQPDKTAVVDNFGVRFSYAAMDRQAGRIASWFSNVGVGAGDVVCVQLPGWVEFTLIYVACLKVGAVINPIIPAYRGRELRHILSACKPKLLFMPSFFRRFDYTDLIISLEETFAGKLSIVRVEKSQPTASGLTLSYILNTAPNPADGTGSYKRSTAKADDIAAILFTSGTESLPKGVLLTHNNIISSIRSFASRLNLNSRDIMLMPSPVGHATGFHHGVTTPFILGGTSVLQDVFQAHEALTLIEREQCTYGMGASSFVYDLMCAMDEKPYDISSMRFFLCGGAASPRHLLESLWERGFRVVNVYGSTESVPHTASAPCMSRDILFMTDGRPVDGCEIKIVDKNRNPVQPGVEGEEASRGPNVFVGYLNDPELTNAAIDDDGWYYSGDIAVMNEHGYVRIVGRKKDIIIRGGENISSREVEEILELHPLVAAAGVVGMPDPRLGERICAFVVLKRKLSVQDLMEHYARHCTARFKYPERIEIVPELPRSPVGKVLKNELRRIITEKLRREAEGVALQSQQTDRTENSPSA